MELWINIFVMMFGAFSIAMSFAMHTKNFRSALLFKIVPFFGDIAVKDGFCYFCDNFGWVAMGKYDGLV